MGTGGRSGLRGGPTKTARSASDQRDSSSQRLRRSHEAILSRTLLLGLSFHIVNFDLPALDEDLIIGLHRAKQKNLPIAFVGGGLPLLPELTREAKTYAERMFRFRRIGPLEPDDARAALTEPAEEQGVSWEEDAVTEAMS